MKLHRLGLAFVVAFVLPAGAQEARLDRRVPPDVSLWNSGGGAPSSIGLRVGLSCIQRIADQATGDCLVASSIPTLGRLFPYPGSENVFDPTLRSFVGGGGNNQAACEGSAIGGGLNNSAFGIYATVGGGIDNVAFRYATVSGGQENSALGRHTTIGGGWGNTVLGADATVAGGSFNESSGSQSTIGGGFGNFATGEYATVGGGGGPLNAANMATGIRSTIGGGSGNLASGTSATVAGGVGNRASGECSSVAGGRENTASGESATVAGGGGIITPNRATGDGSTVGGGVSNLASGRGSTIGGGAGNRAPGNRATIPGGHASRAAGNHSFAAGRRALADHDGAFVWGDSYIDSDPTLKSSSAPDEFNVYASGGARFFTNSAASTGVLLAPGGGSWTAVSDRAAKENVESVDTRSILERVVALPIATWNYRAQADSIRHMGPMAQDFYAAFGLGLGEKTIDTIDPDGVALAAIQGLHTLVEEKDAELDELRSANEELLERLERLERLEERMDKNGR
jgi:hypothetical protein